MGWAEEGGVGGAVEVVGVMEFIDFRHYGRGWQAQSISTALGGLSTMFTILHWPALPNTNKLIKL